MDIKQFYPHTLSRNKTQGLFDHNIYAMEIEVSGRQQNTTSVMGDMELMRFKYFAF